MKGDGYPNDDEWESAAFQSVNFIDGVEVTDEECASYDAGEYEYIEGGMRLEELKDRFGLSQTSVMQERGKYGIGIKLIWQVIRQNHLKVLHFRDEFRYN